MNQEVLRDSRIQLIVSQSPKQGKVLCGDDYFFEITDEYFICVVADGLGSGEFAHESSRAVTNVVREFQSEEVEGIMERCNQALQKKRGAAVAVFKVDFKKREFHYSCVGNIRFYLYPPNGNMIYPLPVTGYLSGRKQQFRTQRFTYTPSTKFFIHSDGFEMKGTKSFLRSAVSLEDTARKLESLNSALNDDITFIFGSLL